MKTSDHSIFVTRRKWKRYTRGFLLAVLLVSLLASAVNAEPKSSTMGMGAAFAPIGGHGFSFRNLPEAGFGYQVGTIFWKNSEDSYFNLGGELIYVLRHTRLTAFYVPFGVGVTYTSQLYYRVDSTYPNQSHEYRETITHFSGGAGIGFTARPASWEEIWFSLDIVMVVDRSDIMPLPQVAIHYFFR